MSRRKAAGRVWKANGKSIGDLVEPRGSWATARSCHALTPQVKELAPRKQLRIVSTCSQLRKRSFHSPLDEVLEIVRIVAVLYADAFWFRSMAWSRSPIKTLIHYSTATTYISNQTRKTVLHEVHHVDPKPRIDNISWINVSETTILRCIYPSRIIDGHRDQYQRTVMLQTFAESLKSF